MEVKDLINSRRLSLGLTMKELADRIGVSEGTISRWESGEISNMKRDKIMALSKALSVSPAAIMGWEDPPAKPAAAFDLSAEEKAIIIAYRTASTDIKNATCAVLGVKREPGIEQDAECLDA